MLSQNLESPSTTNRVNSWKSTIKARPAKATTCNQKLKLIGLPYLPDFDMTLLRKA